MKKVIKNKRIKKTSTNLKKVSKDKLKKVQKKNMLAEAISDISQEISQVNLLKKTLNKQIESVDVGLEDSREVEKKLQEKIASLLQKEASLKEKKKRISQEENELSEKLLKMEKIRSELSDI